MSNPSRLRLRRSRIAAIFAGAFVALAAATQAWLLYSAMTNPADSGEGGLLLLAFTLPWSLILPDFVVEAGWFQALAPLPAWALIGLNAFLLYCIAGGLRIAWRAPGPRA
jgi:hypothetical protein